MSARGQRGDQALGHLGDAGDVHGGREGVVARLAHVHVVVGMDGRLGAHLAAEQLDGAVRDHLVHIHVGLRAAARLEDDQREVLGESAGDDLVGGGDDGAAHLLVHEAGVHVVLRRALL